jgi:hypothetical protein
MKIFTTLFLTIACIGCQTADVELRQKLKAVTLSDGISQSEAETIAESYFRQNVGCGAWTGIQDGGDRWIVEAKFGFGGEPVEGFFIDKQSGKVTSPIGRSYDNPHKIFW